MLKTLIVNGKFTYGKHGILDRTHLRFFTKQSILQLLNDAGLHADAIVQIKGPDRKLFVWFLRLSFGLLDDFFAIQYIVWAKKRPSVAQPTLFKSWTSSWGITD